MAIETKPFHRLFQAVANLNEQFTIDPCTANKVTNNVNSLRKENYFSLLIL